MVPEAHALNAQPVADRIAALPCGERMKRALALVGDGTPYRDAAKQVGYRDHREVYRWSKRAGLLDVHSEQLVAAYKRISALSNAELERRLVENPEAIPTRDLAIIGGIAADKAAKYENWGRPQEQSSPNLCSRSFRRRFNS